MLSQTAGRGLLVLLMGSAAAVAVGCGGSDPPPATVAADARPCDPPDGAVRVGDGVAFADASGSEGVARSGLETTINVSNDWAGPQSDSRPGYKLPLYVFRDRTVTIRSVTPSVKFNWHDASRPNPDLRGERRSMRFTAGGAGCFWKPLPGSLISDDPVCAVLKVTQTGDRATRTVRYGLGKRCPA